ncbi:MAG: cupin domain-containing protein [Gemmatimonadota bacterium]
MTQPLAVPSAGTYASEPVRHPPLTLIDLVAEAAAMPRPYHNAVINQVNSHCLRLAAFEGTYAWHRHPASDELFLVIEGQLHIDFPDAPSLCIGPNQVATIPAGRVHRTRAEARVLNVCFEALGAATECVQLP